MRKHPRAARWRWLIGAVAGGLALAMAGCSGPPDGVDGDLTGGWGGFPDPVGFTPEAQVCHPETHRPVVSVEHYDPVDCAAPHLLETFHVAAFTGEAGEEDAPPEPDSWQWRAAFGQCEEQAEEFLGDGFRDGRIWLGVAVPTQQAWDGGARWFRCDLSELERVPGEPVQREGSLAGALADDSELRLGCYQVAVSEDDVVEERTPVSCDEPHRAEFAGAWRAPDGSYPDADEGGDAVEEVNDGCRSRIASFADIPDDGDVRFRVGTIVDWMSERDWNAGDRAFRCYLWLEDEELTESLRGAGTDALPVRTE